MSVVALELTDYQSHKRTSIELGALTVIVGSSSSGKTAILRGLSTLVNNSRGTSYVRHGAKTAKVTAVLAGSEPVADAQTRVTVERGRNTSVYEQALPGMAEPVRFTKCSTSVPEGVSASLDFGRDGLWLAGQFDRPYLLDETGSQVARVLGNLTGVSMIFAAVRECNRRASAAKASLKERRAELDEVLTTVQRHRDLPQRRSACEGAEQALSAAQRATQRRDRLAGLLTEYAAARRRAEESARPSQALPSVSALLAVSQRRTELWTRLSEYAVARQHWSRQEALRDSAHSEHTAARAAFEDVLSRTGSCPVCGAGVEHQHWDRVVA